jgi:hypothetical protein
VLAKLKMSEKDPALRVMKAVADYCSLHRNLKLESIKNVPKKYVENLVSVIKLATLKALIENKIEMDKSDLKKNFLEFCCLSEEDCYHIRRARSCGRSYERRATPARRPRTKATTLMADVLSTALNKAHIEVAAI